MTLRTVLTVLLLSLGTAPTGAAEPALGRLFFTPQQRAALDRQRLADPTPRLGLDRGTSYTINGEVRRSGGPATRWINGEAELGSPAGSPVTVGDTYHPATGERQNLLRGGQIAIRRHGKPPAAP